MISAILVLLGFLCILAMAYGVVAGFAGSMSDSPEGGKQSIADGSLLFICGLVGLLLIIGIGFWRWFHP